MRVSCVFLQGSCWLSVFFLFSPLFLCWVFLQLKAAWKNTWNTFTHLPTPPSGAIRVLCIASVIRPRLCKPFVPSLGRPRTWVSCLSLHQHTAQLAVVTDKSSQYPSQFGDEDRRVLSRTPSWTFVKSSFKVVSPRSRRRCLAHPQQHDGSSDTPPRLLIGVIARLCEGKVILLTGSLSLLVWFRCSGDNYDCATWVAPPDLDQPINVEAEASQPVQLWVGI